MVYYAYRSIGHSYTYILTQINQHIHACIVLHEAEHLKAEARDLKASNQALMKEIEELKTLAVAASQSATRRRLLVALSQETSLFELFDRPVSPGAVV